MVCPASFRTDQKRGVFALPPRKDSQKGLSARTLIEPDPMLRIIFESLGQTNRIADVRRSQAPRLFAGFARNSPPSLDALLRSGE